MEIEKRAREIVSVMTLEEKADFCSGKNYWETKSLRKHGVHSIMMTDGSHGVRKQSSPPDHIGLTESVPAVCFPTASCSACSFDTELIERMGEAIGDKCLRENVGLLIGPGVNIKRSPLGGRNFEYFSEDPCLTAELACGFVNGIQSKGVGACLKHYAANNQEYAKMINDSVIDERALFDIYLCAFADVIKRTQPYAVLSSYNRVNGVYVSESHWLLTDILRNRFGFDGVVISEWGATAYAVNSVFAGMNLEMPYSGPENARRITSAVRNGEITEKQLDKLVTKTLEMILKIQENTNTSSRNEEMDHELAREIAEKSAVLLKNDGILPLRDQRVAFIGALAKKPRYQGGGSSTIIPTLLENAYDEAIKAGYRVEYAKGYPDSYMESSEELLLEALEVADRAETVVIFAGLPEDAESEGYDRKDIFLPKVQTELIKEISRINQNVVVVLQCGSPVDMEWDANVKAVLLTYLAGQASGSATVNLLWGRVNPSGKLAETWPVKIEDNPSYNYFAKERTYTEYRESVFVGYRYYNTTGLKVKYPFGHGLSYTKFSYDNLSVTDLGNNEFEVSVDVSNIGRVDGADVAEIYVSKIDSKILRPAKELKAFKKVYVKAGMTKTVKIRLESKVFQYHNPVSHGLSIEGGKYRIIVGRDINSERLSEIVNVSGDGHEKLTMNGSNGLLGYKHISYPINISDNDFYIHLGYTPAYKDVERVFGYDMNSSLTDIKHTLIGKIMNWRVRQILDKSNDDDIKIQRMHEEMAKEMPLRSMSIAGFLNLSQVEGIVEMANHRMVSGIIKLHFSRRQKVW